MKHGNMTLAAWLTEQRQPDMCGIFARQHLKAIVGTSGKAIHARVNANAFGAAVRKMCDTLEDARAI